MTQQVQELIDKIKNEGLQAAQQKAQEVEAAAQEEARRIIAQAKAEAARLREAAEQDQAKRRDYTEAALRQASRDALLKLRQEITALMARIITGEVRGTLTPESLARLIEGLAKNGPSSAEGITVEVSESDLTVLKHGFLAKLKDKVKQPLTFKSAEHIRAGLTISYDGGKSCFDFTDAALADYVGGFVNPEVEALLRAGVQEKKSA